MPNTTISAYLIRRLQDLGARHVFGVPGDYVLGFYKALEESELEVINTCDEQGAGFVFEDASGLLQWTTNDRAVVTLRDMADVEVKRAALAEVVSRWIEETG